MKKLRKEQKLNQTELAQKLEVSRNSIVNWETGKCHPDISTIRKIAFAFNISSDYLCGKTEGRHKITATLIEDMDLSLLNLEGLRRIRDLYNLLILDAQFRADGMAI